MSEGQGTPGDSGPGEALQRDWEQTKNDVGAGGQDLDQDVDDTVKQALGNDVTEAGTGSSDSGSPPA